MLVTIEQANRLPSLLIAIGRRMEKFFPSMESKLELAHIRTRVENYFGAVILSAFVYAVIFGVILGVIGYFAPAFGGARGLIQLGIVGSLVSFLGAFLLHLIYPGIMAQQYSTGIDTGLAFAIKSLLIQVNSGVSLYDSMTNVAKSGYGKISEEFEKVVQEINAGMTEATALERLALRTESTFLKKMVWQLVTSIRAGSSVNAALESIMETLTEYQSRNIKNYAAELNMWILLYLLVAAALPTIGITFMVILSAIGGSDISEETIFMTVGLAFVIQIVLIGFIGTRAPKGY
jgi:flagellar protein FlaJ